MRRPSVGPLVPVADATRRSTELSPRARTSTAALLELRTSVPTLLERVLTSASLDLAPADGEPEFSWENRISTRLMALYRDTRDAEVFEALHKLTLVSVERWIASLLRRSVAHLDARELAQDTFVNVYLYPSGFRDEHAGSFRVWVRTIAGNLVRRALSRSRAAATQQLPELGREPADPNASPERAAVCAEQDADLRRAWALLVLMYLRAYEELAQRDRDALHLVEVEALGYLEAGRKLGVGRSNMKMIVFRARRRIARRLELHWFVRPDRATDTPRMELRRVG